jgi:hypothetical protein
VITCALAALCATLGCGGARPGVSADRLDAPPTPLDPYEPVGPAHLTVRVVNHLTWPYRLRRVVVVADGYRVAEVRVPRGREPPGEVSALVRCTPGEHTLQMLMNTDVPMTPEGPACKLELRAVRVVAVAEGKPAEIEADLHLRGLTHDFADRLSLSYRTRGTLPITKGFLEDQDVAKDCPLDALPEVDADRTFGRPGRPGG